MRGARRGSPLFFLWSEHGRLRARGRPFFAGRPGWQYNRPLPKRSRCPGAHHELRMLPNAIACDHDPATPAQFKISGFSTHAMPQLSALGSLNQRCCRNVSEATPLVARAAAVRLCRRRGVGGVGRRAGTPPAQVVAGAAAWSHRARRSTPPGCFCLGVHFGNHLSEKQCACVFSTHG